MIKKISYSLLLLLTLFSANALADSLPERIENFADQFDYESATQFYDIRVLQSDYPTKLLAPESMLPQTAKYPLKDIQQLYRLAETCNGKLPLSPLITEPLVFTRSMCKGTPLSSRWFSRSNLIHPGGGTYAARYVQNHPEQFEPLQQYMHIQERPQSIDNELLTRLQEMDSDAITSLISGASMFVENDELWLRKGELYYLFNSSIWKENAELSGLNYKLSSESTTCLVQRGNLCWDVKDHSEVLRISMIVLIVANIFLVVGWSIYRWNVKKNELKSRMLVLQILTHELRTPIASLSMTVEGFRREFEKLPESVYGEFRKLCEDTRRLRQLAEASKDYLQSDNQTLASEWIPSVQEWLEYKVEGLQAPVTLSFNQDIAAKVNIYWLGTCIDNLIRNAVKYGVAPITLEVTTDNSRLVIRVIDQGTLTNKDWRRLRKPFESKSGLGLGLTIVESMVGRMGGKMTLIGPPTTFILEIPCETDIATR
ncbi:sensor histidine kinase [Vibrio clamense]|uniref:sensor histidine kinase VxrA n=1 Tax=Vibrio TaxID=662 RepID=UPI0021C2CA4E|nr:sensor histidine kinase VxrA [Vibrio cortegadensis]MDN3699330.1 sensor histidine kinase [Vibrio cortegadensis]